ncbi:MAG: hypothetical protein HQL84_11690 [Magnetococcales bacterium]|nr:hypothetical protein [Magnetococcales bacterium]MBF0150697.1 hypothetical protein [Magnetococcales bacterium]
MAENQDSELDSLIQSSAPATESEKQPKAEVPKKSFLSPALIATVVIVAAIGSGIYMVLDSYVQRKNAELAAEFENRRKEYRIQAHRRMYDTIQGQLQTEMMDRMKNHTGAVSEREILDTSDHAPREVIVPGMAAGAAEVAGAGSAVSNGSN